MPDLTYKEEWDFQAITKVRQNIIDGGKVYCISCGRSYKYQPKEWYEDGHGGRELNMCRCGCDLFSNMQDMFKSCIKRSIGPIIINSVPTHIFKQWQLKYCECKNDKGTKEEYWCGSAEFECARNLKLIDTSGMKKTYVCKYPSKRTQDYHIVIIQNSNQENIDHEKEYMGTWDFYSHGN